MAAMPVEWLTPTKEVPEISGVSFRDRNEPPLVRLHLWPHRSLPRRGFVVFISVTFGLLLLPLMAVIGTPVLWGLLPFLLGALALVWFSLEKSYRDGEILEELCLWTDRVELSHQKRTGPPLTWQANPYWMSVEMRKKGGPVENYLTLRGAGREVEIGAFLTPEERSDLRVNLVHLQACLIAAGGQKT